MYQREKTSLVTKSTANELQLVTNIALECRFNNISTSSIAFN